MNTDIDNRKVIAEQYRSDVQQLARYLTWLDGKKDQVVMEQFSGMGGEEVSLKFPVYDGTLMNFVKTAQRTQLMDRNYMYVYNRYRIRSVKDELAFIDEATLRDMDLLGGILSKYVLGGMTKGFMWPEGVKNGVYFALVKKMLELIDNA